MVVRNSLLSAMCVAGLLGAVAVKPAVAQVDNSITVVPNTQIVPGPGASVTVTSFTSGAFTSGLTLTGPLAAFLSSALPVYSGGGTAGPDIVSFAGLPTGTTIGNFSFTSLVSGLPGGANQTVSVTILPSSVPEPGTIAFGVIAAGSVLGLVARKRKA